MIVEALVFGTLFFLGYWAIREGGELKERKEHYKDYWPTSAGELPKKWDSVDNTQ